jgi:uncharacterized protein YcnI
VGIGTSFIAGAIADLHFFTGFFMNSLLRTRAFLRSVRRGMARTGLATCLGLLGAAAAQAHITLEYPVANAGSYYKANFKVGHGCGRSAIRQIVVELPAGAQGAKPMPKAGWTVEIGREKLAQPYQSHGRSVTDDVVRISWTAKTPADYLPDQFYDEFALQVKLPMSAGPLYWPVSQICEQGRIDWHEVPKPGQGLHELKTPAALLDVLPLQGAAHHH